MCIKGACGIYFEKHFWENPCHRQRVRMRPWLLPRVPAPALTSWRRASPRAHRLLSMAALLWMFILTCFGNTICVNNASSNQVNVTHVVSKDTFVFDQAFNLTGRQENATSLPRLSASTERNAEVPVTDGGTRTAASTFTATPLKTTETSRFTATDLQTTETPLVTAEDSEAKILATTNPQIKSGGTSSLPLPLSGTLPQPVTEGITLKMLVMLLLVKVTWKTFRTS